MSCDKVLIQQKTKITNEFAIRNLWTIEKLAKALIQDRQEESVDYDWEERPIHGFTRYYYVASDGKEFDVYEDAVTYEIWWLTQEVSSGE